MKNPQQPLLYVISWFDLEEFGCPHCGNTEGGTFLSFGTCSLWGCESCTREIAIVEETVKELFVIEVRNTNIRDLIGNHPYKDKCLDDRMVVIKRWGWATTVDHSIATGLVGAGVNVQK